jgi:hypothetical protein
MVIFCDEVQAPSDFSYATSCRCCCWHTCAPVWTNFGWLYRQGGRLNFNHMLCCCHIEVTGSRCTNQNFGLLTSNLHLRLIYARTSDVLFKILHVSVTSRASTYILCAIGQCGVLGFPYGTTTSTRTKVACGERGHPGIREDKVKCTR